MYYREVAVRVFAKELKDSNVMYKTGDDHYSPQYILTPTGARVNRVLIAGTMTETENIGTGAEYQRARIADPTGIFTVYAGQYRPDAMQFISDAQTPCLVSVIGKVNSFRTDDGKLIISIRPESIRKIDAEMRDAWIAETAEQTYERLKKLEENPDQEVLKNYRVNLGEYRKMILTALEK